MDYLKYIVPIYAGTTLIGTGILHNTLLVTAAHVIEYSGSEKRLFFYYCQNQYTLRKDDILFYEYDKEKKSVYRDLAIYNTKIQIKGLSFESEKLYDGKVASIYGYYDSNNGNLSINHICGKIRLKPLWNENLKINIPMNKNSFIIMDIPTLYECNSGCPLLYNDKVIGLVSQGNIDLRYSRLVSSSYIIDVLKHKNLVPRS